MRSVLFDGRCRRTIVDMNQQKPGYNKRHSTAPCDRQAFTKQQPSTQCLHMQLTIATAARSQCSVILYVNIATLYGWTSGQWPDVGWYRYLAPPLTAVYNQPVRDHCTIFVLIITLNKHLRQLDTYLSVKFRQNILSQKGQNYMYNSLSHWRQGNGICETRLLVNWMRTTHECVFSNNRMAFLLLWPWNWSNDIDTQTWRTDRYPECTPKIKFLGQRIQKLQHTAHTDTDTDAIALFAVVTISK